MSAILFGPCGCCFSSIRPSGDFMAIEAAAPYNFGWIWGPDMYGNIVPIQQPLAHWPYDTVPAQIFRTLQVNGQTFSYSVWGKLTISDGGSAAATMSDPYTYDDAIKTAMGLLGLVQFGGSFTVKDYYGVETLYRLRYAYEYVPGVANAQKCTITADIDGNPIYTPGSGHYLAARGWMKEWAEGQVMVATSVHRYPKSQHSSFRQWFDLGVEDPIGAVHQIVVPYELAAGEHVFTPDDAPFCGYMSVSTDLPPGLGA